MYITFIFLALYKEKKTIKKQLKNLISRFEK